MQLKGKEIIILVGALALACLTLSAAACTGEQAAPKEAPDGGAAPDTGGGHDGQPTPDMAAPKPDGPAVSCASGMKTGAAGVTRGVQTPAGLGFNLHTPTSYKATVGHPLIVVFAAAGTSANTMEQFTGLAPAAQAAGYVIAFVNAADPTTTAGIQRAAQVVAAVSGRWCIDGSRVYYTGHSAGGSMIYALIINRLGPLPAAIAPSAAGVSSAVFAQVSCPSYRVPTMVLHSKDDELFPGFGQDARTWWAACNGCQAGSGTKGSDGCIKQAGCASGADVLYCEGTGLHHIWPGRNSAMIAFFDRFRRGQ